MILMIVIILLIVGYIAIAMHSVSLIDDGKVLKLVWVTEKIDSDGMPFTRVNTLVLWKY
jgi:hypothetical protein